MQQMAQEKYKSRRRDQHVLTLMLSSVKNLICNGDKLAERPVMIIGDGGKEHKQTGHEQRGNTFGMMPIEQFTVAARCCGFNVAAVDEWGTSTVCIDCFSRTTGMFKFQQCQTCADEQ